MPTQYIVVKERGLRGVNATKWNTFTFDVPDPFNNEIPLPAFVDTSLSGDLLLMVFVNGVQQESNYYEVDGLTLTWNHPVLSLLPSDIVRIWYIPTT